MACQLQSRSNRIKLRPVVPGRGLIYDRKGRILADNVPAFRLEVTPNEAGDPRDWLPSLGKLVELSPDEVAEFQETRKVSRGFVVAVGPGLQPLQSAAARKLAHQAVCHPLVPVAGMDGDLQHASAIGFLHHDGEPGQVLTAGGVGILVRGLQGQGQR